MAGSARARAFAALLVLLATGSGAGPAAAQQAPPPSIIVVDLTQIMRDAKAAKDVQAQVERAMNAYSKQMSEKEANLKAMRDTLERQRTMLAPDALNARSEEVQQRYVELDNEVQATHQKLQQSYGEAMTKVEKMAMQIIAEVAKERKANIVLAREALRYMDDGLDVTAEVTRRLDEKLPAMPVTLLTDAGAAAPKARN